MRKIKIDIQRFAENDHLMRRYHNI